MRNLLPFFFVILLIKTNAQVYHNISAGPFLQNWNNTGLITTSDNWSGVQSIIGYLGDDASTTANPFNPQTALSALFSQTADVIANQNNPSTLVTGGVAEFEIANPVVALQGSGTADAPNIIIYLNTNGVTGIRVKYLLRDIDGATDNAVQPVALQYRIGNSGNFVDIPAAFIADASSGPSTATLETQIDVILPLECNNQAELQLRIITGNATGSDEWIGIDDIEISSSLTDVTPPTIASLNPLNNSTAVNPALTATLTFSESVQKGSGTITIKKNSDNAILQSLDVTTASVNVSGTSATFSASLLPFTQYYVEISAGAFKDLANNNFAGFNGNNTWLFETGTGAITNFNFDFNSCNAGNIPGNSFTQFSVSGDSIWKCTSFGFGGTNGTQITGFSVTQGALQNEDWLISPSLNLTGFNVPLLKFRSRTRFAGLSLKLFVSTNYSGTGNPAAAAWTEINGRFPELNSDTWTWSDSINLNNYKSASTYIAWVYYSTSTDGAARWTLDDVSLYSNTTAPQPSLTISNRLPRFINFGIIPNGNTSATKQFSFWANELAGNLTVTAPAGFELSKDNTAYTTSIVYNNTDLNNLQSPFIRFKPNAVDAGFGGSILFSSSNFTQSKVDVGGSSLPQNKSLDIVNWNLTWFGSTANPPANDVLQMQNTIKVMDSLDADMYFLQEIVDTSRLGTVARALKNGPYNYIVSLYGSGAADNTSGNWPGAQKLAYIYRSNMFSNITSRAFTATSTNPDNYFNWSSGRYPFLMEADVTLDGITKRISFLNVHAKADLGVLQDYQRRKGGADVMADSLNSFYNINHFMIAGDYNDDLDVTISTVAGTTVTSYIAFTSNVAAYTPVSLWNSVRGENSYLGEQDVIDHAIISNEMNLDYHPFSCNLVTEAVKWVNFYEDSLTNHIPLLTRFNLRQSNTNLITSVRSVIRDNNFIKVLGNPGKQPQLQFGQSITGDVQLRLLNTNGQLIWEKRLKNVFAGELQLIDLSEFSNGVYTISIITREGIVSRKLVK